VPDDEVKSRVAESENRAEKSEVDDEPGFSHRLGIAAANFRHKVSGNIFEKIPGSRSERIAFYFFTILRRWHQQFRLYFVSRGHSEKYPVLADRRKLSLFHACSSKFFLLHPARFLSNRLLPANEKAGFHPAIRRAGGCPAKARECRAKIPGGL
jgi:hypothetical protein